MAKKGNTLNDLNSFLNSDSIKGTSEFTSEVEKDFFTKKPFALVDVEKDVLEELNPLLNDVKIDLSKKLTLETLQNIISTFVKENNVTIEEIVSTIKTNHQIQTQVNPFITYFNWTIDYQINFFKFLLEIQKGMLNNIDELK